MDEIFGPRELLAVSFNAVHVAAHGWNLSVRRVYASAPREEAEWERYDRLSTGEMLDIYDAVREGLDLSTEY